MGSLALHEELLEATGGAGAIRLNISPPVFAPGDSTIVALEVEATYNLGDSSGTSVDQSSPTILVNVGISTNPSSLHTMGAVGVDPATILSVNLMRTATCNHWQTSDTISRTGFAAQGWRRIERNISVPGGQILSATIEANPTGDSTQSWALIGIMRVWQFA
jgi:hypothetical protein